MIRAWPANLRLQQAPRIEDVLLEGRAYGAERAADDGMVRFASTWITCGVTFLLCRQSYKSNAATYGTIGTGGTLFP